MSLPRDQHACPRVRRSQRRLLSRAVFALAVGFLFGLLVASDQPKLAHAGELAAGAGELAAGAGELAAGAGELAAGAGELAAGADDPVVTDDSAVAGAEEVGAEPKIGGERGLGSDAVDSRSEDELRSKEEPFHVAAVLRAPARALETRALESGAQALAPSSRNSAASSRNASSRNASSRVLARTPLRSGAGRSFAAWERFEFSSSSAESGSAALTAAVDSTRMSPELAPELAPDATRVEAAPEATAAEASAAEASVSDVSASEGSGSRPIRVDGRSVASAAAAWRELSMDVSSGERSADFFRDIERMSAAGVVAAPVSKPPAVPSAAPVGGRPGLAKGPVSHAFLLRSSLSGEEVCVERVTPPGADPAELLDSAMRQRRIEARRPWFECEGSEMDYSEPPSWLDLPERSPFHVSEPPDSDFARAVKTVARRKFYREVRRFSKRQWSGLYEESLTMPFDFYEERLLRINQLGRAGDDYDVFSSNYYSNTLRDRVFEEGGNQGERDIPILAWGPFVLLDSGSLRFDLGRLSLDDARSVRLGESQRSHVFSGENLRIDTRIRVHLDPMEVMSREGDLTWLIKRYGVSMNFDFLSAILGRELVSTEIEARVDRDGDFAAAVNFIISSR